MCRQHKQLRDVSNYMCRQHKQLRDGPNYMCRQHKQLHDVPNYMCRQHKQIRDGPNHMCRQHKQLHDVPNYMCRQHKQIRDGPNHMCRQHKQLHKLVSGHLVFFKNYSKHFLQNIPLQNHEEALVQVSPIYSAKSVLTTCQPATMRSESLKRASPHCIHLHNHVSILQIETYKFIQVYATLFTQDMIQDMYIIIIIIIQKDRQCKALRGRLTPYQSEDPIPTLPTYRGKEEKRISKPSLLIGKV